MLFLKTKKKRGRPPKQKETKRGYLILGLLAIFLGASILIINSGFLKTKAKSEVKNRSQEKIATTSGSPSINEPIKISSSLLSAIETTQPPFRILVPGIFVDLPIVEAKVVNGFWELSENSASHGIGSANPGENGNIIIFAHARTGLFYNLKDLKNDAPVYLLTKDRWYRYRVREIKSVYPNQVETIAPTTDETLTLYTCSGFLDEKRLLVIAKPER